MSSQFRPGVVASGGTSTWTGTLSNPGKVDLVDVAFGLAFPDPVVPDLTSVTTTCAGSFVPIDPKRRLAGDPQVVGSGIVLAPGATCTLTIDVVPGDGAFTVVSGAPVAANAPGAGSVAVATIEAAKVTEATQVLEESAEESTGEDGEVRGQPAPVAPIAIGEPREPDARTAAIEPAPTAAAAAAVDWNASVEFGVTPLAVQFAPSERDATRTFDSWTVVFSDGTGQTRGRGPLTTVPHTFVNDGDEPVVFHADLTAVEADGSVTRSRRSVTVLPKGSDSATVVADTSTPATRGESITLPVLVVNPGTKVLEAPTLTLKVSDGTQITASADGWQCTGTTCTTDDVPPLGSSPVLDVTLGPIPLAAPPTIRIDSALESPGLTTVSGTIHLRVEGFDADAGPDQTVDATQPSNTGEPVATTVILDGSGSTAAVGRPRTFTWRQTDGPTVVVDTGADPSGQRARFTVPDPLTENATFVFELTVSDGVSTDVDTVTVTALRSNAAPTIAIGTGSANPAANGAIVPPVLLGRISLTAQVSDPDGDDVTVTWTAVGAPDVRLTTAGDNVSLPWPIPGRPFVSIEAKATDAFGLTSVDTISIGTPPVPVTLAVTASTTQAPGGSVVTMTALPSRTNRVTIAWTQVSGPSVTLPRTAPSPQRGATARVTLPSTVLGPQTIVIRATATPADGASPASSDISLLATPAPPLSVVLAPTQPVDPGQEVTLDAVIGGPQGATVQWSQLAGPTVVTTRPTQASATFTAPDADTLVVMRVTVTAGERVVTADQAIDVGTLEPAAPVAGCADGSVLQRVADGERVLLLGSNSTVLLGDVPDGGDDCDPAATLTHEGTSVNLFDFILGDDLAGTIDDTKVCFTSGTVRLASKFDLPPITIGAIPLCVVYASVGGVQNPTPQGLVRPAGERGRVAQQTPCSFPLLGDLRWEGEVPFFDLPSGFTPGTTILTIECDRLALTSDATVDAAGRLEFAGEITADGGGSTRVTASGIELFGGSLDGELLLEYDGSLDVSGTLDVVDPDLGVDGLDVERLGLSLEDGTLRLTGRMLLGEAAPRLGIEVDGSFTSLDEFSVAVTAATTEPWEPSPGVELPAGQIAGVLARTTDGVTVDIAATTSTPWSVAAGVTVRQIGVRITNAVAPDECPTIEEGSLFITLGGTAEIEIPDRSTLTSQVEACLGLPSNDDPAFSLRSVTALPPLSPDPAVDFSIDRLELSVEYVSGEIEASLRGDARVLGISLSAKLLFRTSPTGDVLVALATGDVRPLGTPISTGTIVFSTANLNDVEIDDGLVVDVDAGLSLIATIDLGEGQRQLLNDVLSPPTPIEGTLIVSATLGGSSLTFTAAIDFGADGIELFTTCPTAPCDPDAVTTTRFQLNSGFLKLRVGTSGFQLGVGGEGSLFLPPAEITPTAERSRLDLAVEAFFRPPAEVGLSFSLLADDGWPDAVGIPGLTVNALVAQGSIDFTVPNAPVPSIGILAEVSRLPDPLAELIGYTNNGEPVRMAINIAPKNPIVDISVGVRDERAVLKPLAAIDGDATDLDDALTIDNASIVFAPLGGSIGSITYEPGVSMSFGATLLGTPIQVDASVDVPGLRIQASVFVGTFEINGITVNDTDVLFDLQPLGFRARISGGVDIPDGPSVAATFDVQAGVLEALAPASAPLPSTSLPRPTAGLFVIVDMGADTWNIAPGTSLRNFELHAEASLDAVEATFDASFSARADATVMGQEMAFEGEATFADGSFEEIHIRFNPGNMSVNGVVIFGDGRCQTSLVGTPPPTTSTGGRGAFNGPLTPTAPPRLGTSGACFQLDYVAAASPPIAIGFNGELAAGSVKAQVKALVDGRLASFEGTVALGALGSLDVDGTLFHGADALLADQRVRVKDATTTVRPSPGSWRIDGRFDQGRALGGVSAPWAFSAGSVDPFGSPTRTTWGQLSGAVSRPGFSVTVKGDIVFVNGQMRYTLVGQSALRVDESAHVINSNPDPNPITGGDAAANSLHSAIRLAVFAADPAPPSHQNGPLEQVVGRLYGSASYRLEIEVRHDRAPRFDFEGASEILYSEAFKRGSSTRFVEETRTRWNAPVSFRVAVNSATGRACFRWGEPGDFATQQWGSC
ncbi:MAG: hypothetical protein ABJH68_14600 [Ilumatobacter sp.]|uniref:PKD domain-containing protein n=1 Tax=Ilumatobacter sp. TaxID=1967498 RepID=UPI003297468F